MSMVGHGGMGMSEQLALVRLEMSHQPLMLDLLEDFHSAGETQFRQDILEKLQTNFGSVMQQFEREESSDDLPEGKVPQSTLWLMHQGSKLLGRVNLRHRLTPYLEHHGGHSGCFIRPSAQGKGYGTQMLSLALEEARKLGLARVLMTCDVDNPASARVIKKNGGVLASQGISNVSGKLISRYWIPL
jgi:predicted acetyltransferase